MANYMSIFFLISALVLLFSTSSLGTTLDLPLDLSQITGLQVVGSVTCPVTSNLPYAGGSVGVAGVPVTATCDGVTGISPAGLRATTNSSGIFTLPITGLNGDALAFQPDQPIICYVTVSLPVVGTSCQTFPSTGSLQALIDFDRVVENVIGGLLAIFNVGPFVYTA